jgi:hypothetical protein
MKVMLLTRERLRLLCWGLIITYLALAAYQLGGLGPHTGGIKNSDFVLLWSASRLALDNEPGKVYRVPQLVRRVRPQGEAEAAPQAGGTG